MRFIKIVLFSENFNPLFNSVGKEIICFSTVFKRIKCNVKNYVIDFNVKNGEILRSGPLDIEIQGITNPNSDKPGFIDILLIYLIVMNHKENTKVLHVKIPKSLPH